MNGHEEVVGTLLGAKVEAGSGAECAMCAGAS